MSAKRDHQDMSERSGDDAEASTANDVQDGNDNKRSRHDGRDRRKKKGRGGKWRKGKKGGDRDSQRSGDDDGRHDTPLPKSNAKFDAYYKLQGIVAEDEYETLMETLTTPLPLTFRVSESGLLAKNTRKRLATHFSDLRALDAEPHPVSWYPGGYAYQLDKDKRSVRKNDEFRRMQDFLIAGSNFGSITRQELVSMIPPLLLDVQPQHNVVDMCAAPGSKTTQMLEYMHQDTSVEHRGVLVANDVDIKRCYMLYHNCKRVGAANVIVTNYDSVSMPSLYRVATQEEIDNGTASQPGRFSRAEMFASSNNTNESSSSSSSSSSGGGNEVNDAALEQMALASRTLPRVKIGFDRVLCDVPCSGDGTLRKSPELFLRWGCGMGNGLHKTQLGIAMRGLRLLKVGGMMVYSTCSLNPIENEAVLAELILQSNGCAEIVDVSDRLQGLVRRPGMLTWQVCDHDSTHFPTFEDVPHKRRKKILPSMFPPTEEESKAMGLHLAMRIMPHDQNTGGFFIALIRKTDDRLPSTLTTRVTAERVVSVPVDESDLLSTRPDMQRIQSYIDEKKKTQEEEQEGEPTKLPSIQVVDNDTDEVLATFENVPDTDWVFTLFEKLHNECDVDMKYKHLNHGSKSLSDRIQLRQIEGLADDPVLRVVANRKQGKKEEKFTEAIMLPAKTDKELVETTTEYYGLTDDFPWDNMFFRYDQATNTGGKPRRVFYVEDCVRDALMVASRNARNVSTGLRAFVRQRTDDSESCEYRLAVEALHVVHKYVTKRRVRFSRADMEGVLADGSEMPLLTCLTEATRTKLTQAQASEMVGSMMVTTDNPEEGEPDLIFPVWKSNVAMNLMLDKLFLKELRDAYGVRIADKKDADKSDDKSNSEPADEADKDGENKPDEGSMDVDE